MTREEKSLAIDQLTKELTEESAFYLADISYLNAEDTTKLRRLCANRSVGLKIVKNTLLKKAMKRVEDKDFGAMLDVLKGNTSIMFTETGNAPAKLIKEFRKKNDRPILKAAYIEQCVYIGDDMLDTLADLKSKNELIADVIALLQSPAKNVISALGSAPQTLAGLVQTLSQREN